MKKIIFILLAFIVGVGFIFVINQKNNEQKVSEAYLRIHIRANSNEEQDQLVKIEVKEAIVNFLTPLVKNCDTLNEAHGVLKRNLTKISAVATKTLEEKGFYYGARAKLREEAFPTRAYNDVVLPEGVYDALIVELGSGAGDNWWCVVYPPLCFVSGEPAGTNGVVVKSKIVEILRKNNIL